MKRRPVIRLVVIAMGFLVGVFVLQHSSAAVFDLGADFSSIENPNGRWQYGYSATLSLATNEFRLMGLAATNYPISFWHPWSTNNSGDGYYPYVACNPSTNTLTDPTSGWAARADEVAMEASSSGQYSMVRFVAAQAGVYRLEAAFAGIHFRLSSTDVHILINTTPIFAADIDGYGGDPAFHAIVGTQPSASYSGLLHLQAGDILTFAVGYGKDGTHYNDTTGLFVHLESPAAPLITAVSTAGQTSTIVSFVSILGASHELQMREDLFAGSWSTVTNQVSGTGGVLQISDPSLNRYGKRFYRIQASF